MLENEKFYEQDDLKGMLKGNEISGDEMQGDYFAIGDNGKAYHATYVNKYLSGGVFYFTIPADVKVLGYVPVKKEKTEDLEELFEKLKVAEEKTNKAQKEWKKNPESREKEKEFDKAYEAEFAAYEALASEIQKTTDGKIDKKTAGIMIKEKRNELKNIITKNKSQEQVKDRKKSLKREENTMSKRKHRKAKAR